MKHQRFLFKKNYFQMCVHISVTSFTFGVTVFKHQIYKSSFEKIMICEIDIPFWLQGNYLKVPFDIYPLKLDIYLDAIQEHIVTPLLRPESSNQMCLCLRNYFLIMKR